jgi:uncharacterized protein YyaL (SSP411 family)
VQFKKTEPIMIFIQRIFISTALVVVLFCLYPGISISGEEIIMIEYKTKPNRLINEKSPYLLQHAYNPVDWYPWEEEALNKSKSENKPIILSIGYSTCHWCHVMEEESFMNPAIAELMNNNFVCIKVDREERPDLDKIYITAVSAITGSAGWPLNVFLTPELKPFFGGTYFPPVSKPGISSWPELLQLITAAWKDPSSQKKLFNSGQEITNKLADYLTWTSNDAPLNQKLLNKALENLSLNYDERSGGFSRAPKFPSPSIQNFLMNYHYFAVNNNIEVQHKDSALAMCDLTLRTMANGGIYDHIGGGFHRYSTDGKWHVPHFEKMLYDNAQLVNNYLDAYLVTRVSFFKKIARETADYVLRDMTHPDGGFYSAEDADSIPADSGANFGDNKKVEGAFYVWEQKEINNILGPDMSKVFNYRYGVQAEGNVEYDQHGDFKGKNILFAAHSLDETAEKFNESKDKIAKVLKESKIKLLQGRSARHRPHLDDKILTSWNGLMISAFSRAYQVLEEEKYLKAARNAAEFIQKNLYDSETKILYRRWRKGERKIAGMAGDYAFLVQGLIDLYETDFNPRWLDWALELTDEQIRLFYDEADGGFFMTSKEHDENLIMRVKEDSDSVIPSASSVAVLNLLRLSRFIDSKKYSTVAERTLKSVLSRVNSYPDSAVQMLVALIYSFSKPVEIIITGNRKKEDTRSLLKSVYSRYMPGKIVMLVENENDREKLAINLPFLSSVKTKEGKAAAAYVCIDRTCKSPVTDPAELDELLN